MEIVPITFYPKREDTLLSIMSITGMAKDVPGAKTIMIGVIARIIGVVETKYKGKAIEPIGHDKYEKLEEGKIYVKCYFLFKEESDLKEAVLGIKKELG